MYRYLYENFKIFFNQGTIIESQIALPAQIGTPGVFDKEWYLTFLSELVERVLTDIDDGNVPLYIKSAIMYLFWAREAMLRCQEFTLFFKVLFFF